METTYGTTKGMLLAAPLPEQTRTYKPVSHAQLMDLTLESIHQAGFELQTELYSSARNGNVANGKFAIRNVADSEMQLQIGWQNSLWCECLDFSLVFFLESTIITTHTTILTYKYSSSNSKF